jgi:hypothetical protein
MILKKCLEPPEKKMLIFDFRNKKNTKVIYTVVEYEYAHVHTGTENSDFDVKVIGVRHTIYLEIPYVDYEWDRVDDLRDRETCLTYVRALTKDEEEEIF